MRRAGSDPLITRAFERTLAFLVRPVLAPMVQRYLRGQARPSFNERASFGGPRPLRVLIVGAGLAVGYGGEQDAEPLPKQLARALGAELGRGVIVETRAQASVRLDQTIDLIGMTGAATFDVVIWSPTLEETVRSSAGVWTREVRRIVAHVRRSGTPRVHTVLMGVPEVEGLHLLQRLGASMASDVNSRVEAVAAESDRTEFLPVPSRRIESWDTPLFDQDYQRRVSADLAHLLGDRQRREAARAEAAFRGSADDGVRIDGRARRNRDASG